mgnify:CR=1 FL=1|tara:strand:- start:479 stop:667 length:189 start_codon:yes stop_codon:yes gene_type:complete
MIRNINEYPVYAKYNDGYYVFKNVNGRGEMLLYRLWCTNVAKIVDNKCDNDHVFKKQHNSIL